MPNSRWYFSYVIAHPFLKCIKMHLLKHLQSKGICLKNN